LPTVLWIAWRMVLGPLAQQFLHAPTPLRLALVHGQRAVIPALLAVTDLA
jgi:hypothetical protein